ncbi:MAG: peptidylprolyl isomerase [Candidatus Gracilibacteria bacterium]|nr:peptidylprolyl isomerase [Candidatus Gracilibacteria bacterium]MDD3120620.1 peptidylprolyl isomerase [Candidatus Gracilibacteria bacterium]
MQTKIPNKGDIIAIIDTNVGKIKIRFFPELTPKTFENFVTLVKNGYYDSTIFHRVIKDFMIQGGDPEGTGMGGESIFGDVFEDEFSELKHIKGAISMANVGPNTNGSQFFIVHAKATPYLNGHHSVFGQVFDGIQIVDKIASSKTDRDDKPLKDIIVKKIVIEEF